MEFILKLNSAEVLLWLHLEAGRREMMLWKIQPQGKAPTSH
jgi:hypothetical protein